LIRARFLSPEERQNLRDEELDTAAAFRLITLDVLKAAPFNLKTGRASKLLDAAGVGVGATTASNVVIKLPEEVDLDVRIDQALATAHADPTTMAKLPKLGVTHVVLTAGRVSPAKTKAMRIQYLAGREPATFQGDTVVNVAELLTAPTFRNPRSGRDLQGLGETGLDEVTELPWGSLGLEGLRVVAFGEKEGFFAGMSDAQVIEEMRLSENGDRKTLRAKVEKRATNTRVDLASMDSVVVRSFTQANDDDRKGAPIKSADLQNNLYKIFLRMFDSRELRSLVYFTDETLRASLPEGTVTHDELAFATARLLIRHGHGNNALRLKLRALRPNRVNEIDSAFTLAGIGA
jgi:hypothetical protein